MSTMTAISIIQHTEMTNRFRKFLNEISTILTNDAILCCYQTHFDNPTISIFRQNESCEFTLPQKEIIKDGIMYFIDIDITEEEYLPFMLKIEGYRL